MQQRLSQLGDSLKGLRARAETFVKERPMAALGIGAAALMLLRGRRGRR
jgi:hypothetical protein